MEIDKASSRIIPYKGIRKIIGDRMHESLNVMAQAHHRLHVDMTSATAFRIQYKKTTGLRLSFTDIIIKATALALKDFPIMNSELTEEGILLHEEVHVGIAVATERGLLVPVIRSCEKKRLAEIAVSVVELSEKARISRLPLSDMSGGTFTISNLGMFGLEGFTAIINPPQVGILAVGAIIKTPAVIGESILIRQIMEISLTYDHRIVDGAPAAQFLVRIKTLLEDVGWCKAIM